MSISILQSVFLPQGYPESVSNDYLKYQIWDTVQVFYRGSCIETLVYECSCYVYLLNEMTCIKFIWKTKLLNLYKKQI